MVGFLEELPGIFYLPVPTEMVLPGTFQSWRNPGGILANQQVLPGFLVVPQE
jgi:hypothetical protein